MNIDDMTVGQIKEVAALAKGFGNCDAPQQPEPTGPKIAVLVWTEHRGVIFGYTAAPNARPINLTDARMCLYWSKATGGVFGLAEKGPDSDCRISATIQDADFEAITGVARVTAAAETAWVLAKVQGRD
jgi:hypothetical protein